MDFDEIVDKSKKAVKDTTGKLDDARRSEKAGKAREEIVGGFDKFMKLILPGSHKQKREEAAHRLVESSGETAPKELSS